MSDARCVFCAPPKERIVNKPRQRGRDALLYGESIYTSSMVAQPAIQADIDAMMCRLRQLPVEWDGKKCVLELKENNYH